MFGGVAKREPFESAWTAQLDIEEASLLEKAIVVATVDYHKYFDSFDTLWTKEFMIAIGIPEYLAEMHFDLYDNLIRTIKIGEALGEPFHPDRGIGQGDPFSSTPQIRANADQR